MLYNIHTALYILCYTILYCMRYTIRGLCCGPAGMDRLEKSSRCVLCPGWKADNKRLSQECSRVLRGAFRWLYCRWREHEPLHGLRAKLGLDVCSASASLALRVIGLCLSRAVRRYSKTRASQWEADKRRGQGMVGVVSLNGALGCPDV